MAVEKVFGTISDGNGWVRTVIKIDNKVTPYAVVSGYDPETQSWKSAYEYVENKQTLAAVILGFIAHGGEFNGELVFQKGEVIC